MAGRSASSKDTAGTTPIDPDRVRGKDVAEAKQLLEQSGAHDLAQQTEDSATRPATHPQGAALARQWGFGSYLELFEASKPVATEGSRHWMATNVGPDKWIVWNDGDFNVLGTFKTPEEAAAQVPHPKPQAPPPPTG